MLSDVAQPGSERGADLEYSAWFSRGWTLQELIAPPNVEFYDSSWVNLGNKDDFWIYEAIHFRTKIPIAAITTGDLSLYSVAQRMSWAAGRETTRPEDLAYCLLGLFDINMPLLYGEGTKAFLRLQEEIIRISDDMSIFAWTDAQGSFASYSGLLAASPSHFSTCQHIVRKRPSAEANHPESEPYQVTNKGIRIPFQLAQKTKSIPQDEYAAVLQDVVYEDLTPLAGTRRQTVHLPLAVCLQKLNNNQFVRVQTDKLIAVPGSVPIPPPTTILVRQIGRDAVEIPSHAKARGIILSGPPAALELRDVRPARWDSTAMILYFAGPQWSKATLGPAAFKFHWTATHSMTGKTFRYHVGVNIDLGRPWGEVANAQISPTVPGPETSKAGSEPKKGAEMKSPELTPTRQTLLIAPPRNPEDFGIQLTLRRELVGQDLYIKMSFTVENDRRVCLVVFFVG
jgi:hypothetical protein